MLDDFFKDDIYLGTSLMFVTGNVIQRDTTGITGLFSLARVTASLTRVLLTSPLTFLPLPLQLEWGLAVSSSSVCEEGRLNFCCPCEFFFEKNRQDEFYYDQQNIRHNLYL